MRKKFFAMYALVGALVASPVFTSCVDDSESASVTAIRNAKAEQLKAMAELDKAEAAYQLATAALKNAEAEYKANQTAEAKAEFVYKIESLKAQYEASVMQYKANKVQCENSLKSYENSTITTAVNKYTSALDKVNDLNEDLLEAKMDLAQVGIDSTKNVALLKEHVAKQNAIIAQKTAEIENLKAYEGESKESLYSKMQALDAVKDNLSKEKTISNQAKTSANTATTNAKTAYAATATEYGKAITALNNITTTNVTTDFATAVNFDVEATDPLYGVIESYTFSEAKILQAKQDLNAALAAAKDVLGAPKAGEEGPSGAYETLAGYEAVLKAAQDALAALAADATANAKAAAEKAVEDAEIAVAKYKESTEDGTTPLDIDGTPGQDTDADGNPLFVPAGFAYAQNLVAKAEKAVAEFEALLATVAEGSDAHKVWLAAQEAVVKATEAETAAKKAYDDVDAELTAAGTEYTNLETLYNATANVATLIAEAEADIAEAKAKIEKGLDAGFYGHEETVTIEEDALIWDETANDWIDGKVKVDYTYVVFEGYIYDLSDEDLKALAEAEIAAIEAELAIQKQLLAKYEAELQALLAAE